MLFFNEILPCRFLMRLWLMFRFRGHFTLQTVTLALPLAWAAAGLALSLNTWLRRFPAELMDPRGELSLPAVDILEVGPGNLWQRESKKYYNNIHIHFLKKMCVLLAGAELVLRCLLGLPGDCDGVANALWVVARWLA